MFLTKLTVNPRSTLFRMDVRDVHNMHRTVMSGFPEDGPNDAYRQEHGVLWRLDHIGQNLVHYVQSITEPDWSRLPDDHLLGVAQVRPLAPLLDGIGPGQKFAFRLQANATRFVRPPDRPHRPRREPIRKPADQISWLVRKGDQHGFVIPTGPHGQPEVTTTTVPQLTGNKKNHKVTIAPLRFDGHLVVTNPQDFRQAITTGIGRAKAYGCGLLSLARPVSS